MTSDPRVYYIASRVLKENKIPFYSLKITDKIPFDVEVIVTSEKDSKEIDFPVKIIVRDETFIDELLLKLEGKKKFKTVFIAIDPGERPGVSVVADNRVLEVYHLKSPKDIDVIIQLLEKYPGAKIKIGHGAKRHRVMMLKSLAKILGEDYPIILVNEKGTTPRVGGVESWAIQDIVASINIGLREGREVKIRELIKGDKVTKGEIENIKARSRILSGGKITISSELAREVALGNITIEEAIEIQKKRMRWENDPRKRR
ncbi:putative ORFZ protein [Pyrococcus sp. ST04]|nr:putative ORFZ protein [Pyrococcus sp. ST04]